MHNDFERNEIVPTNINDNLDTSCLVVGANSESETFYVSHFHIMIQISGCQNFWAYWITLEFNYEISTHFKVWKRS